MIWQNRYQWLTSAIKLIQSQISIGPTTFANILSGGDDFTKSEVLDKDFIRDFMKNANSLESHLSIIHSRNVGCHNPNADVSALELNESSFCADCLVLNKTSIKEEEFNPFSCWRRGNLYGKVGFALSLDLIYKEGVKVWEIDCDNITLAVTKPIFANLCVKECKRFIQTKPPDGCNDKYPTLF